MPGGRGHAFPEKFLNLDPMKSQEMCKFLIVLSMFLEICTIILSKKFVFSITTKEHSISFLISCPLCISISCSKQSDQAISKNAQEHNLDQLT